MSKLGLLVLGLLALFAGALGISAERLQAQTNPFEDPAQVRTLENSTLVIDPQPQENGNSAEVEPTSPSGDNINHPTTAWSEWVFQSFRNKQDYNIFWANGDRTEIQRLTNSPADDIHPHLNRGNTRIVFSSNRDGDYELYSMNTDGSGLIKLTDNTTDDVYPRWSPDGSQIAFTSYRDGQPEIYVMDADGTRPRRLTTAPGFDSMPDWSPDGSQIAFSSDRSGGYRIYKMQADGSQVTQLSTKPYSLRPKWSPDGNTILFDAEFSSGYQNLMLVNSNGQEETETFVRKGYYSEFWADGWSPDGTHILFTALDIRPSASGGWLIYDAVSYIQEADDDKYIPHSIDGLLPKTELDFGAVWQTTDTAPPHSHVVSLPPYSHIDNLRVMTGHTDDLSGINHVDIQTNVAGSGWQTLPNERSKWMLPFEASAGDTVQFRTRSHDTAWNGSNWSETPAQTTVYAQNAMGQLTTNDGTPLEQIALEGFKHAINIPQTDSFGWFEAYLTTNDTQSIGVNRTGYGSFKPVSIKPTSLEASFYLPPTDDVILNGDFEEGANGLPAGWEVSDEQLVRLLNSGLTGSGSVILGKDCPAPCTQESELDLSAEFRWTQYLLSDDHGSTFLIIYANVAGIPTNNLLLVRDKAGQWSNLIELPHGNHLFADLDANGMLHLVWVEEEKPLEIISTTLEWPDKWGDEQLVLKASGDDLEESVVSFEVDTLGRGHILTTTESFYSPTGWKIEHRYYRQRANGTWAEPVTVGSIDEYHQSNAQMTVDGLGRVHFLWNENLPYYQDAYSEEVLWHRMVDSQGKLTGARKVFEFVDNRISFQPRYVIGGPDGTVHAAYKLLEGTIGTFTIEPDGHIGPLETNIFEKEALFLTPKIDTDNNLHVAYKTSSYEGEWFYQTRTPHNQWTEPVSIGQAEERELTFDQSACWFHLTHTNDSYQHDTVGFESCVVSPTAETYELSQEVTISAEIDNPMLSFMAQRQHMFDLENSYLEVVIRGATMSHAQRVSLPTRTWTQHSIDMSPWAGQTVEIAFNLHQQAGDPLAQIAVDSISLGSAYPDLTLHASGPQTVGPGETFTVALSAENRSIISADNASLTLSLPSSIEFMEADVAPDGRGPLRWDLGQLSAETPATIFVTLRVRDGVQANRTVNLTADVHTDSAEIETFNNQHTQAVTIGYRQHLPSIIGN